MTEYPGLSYGLSGVFHIWEGRSMNKNHEGYTDYTACEAVRRADRDRKRKRTGENSPFHLTYRLEEASGFAEAKNTVCR